MALAALRDPRRRDVKLTFVKPCYWIVDQLDDSSTVVDFGLGFDADFSVAMIERYGLKSFGFDPTRKHQQALEELETTTGGNFTLSPAAIGAPGNGASSEMVEFFESMENVSGSLMQTHCNVQRDTIRKYPVELITIAEAFERAGCAEPDLVKMDIEGQEYEALDAASDGTLRSARQWVIEFHHDLLDTSDFARTQALIARFGRLGFATYTRDNVNFLFYRRSCSNAC